MSQEISELNARVLEDSRIIGRILAEIEKVIVGQRRLLERMMIALITSGHILIEGVPGLAKTLSIKTLASVLDLSFSRIQFTPDLLPADLTGTLVFDPGKSSFFTRKGPVFTNLLLADEINRAPAKVQSALLEAMQELQVTIGSETHHLPAPFMVMATQNPIEQEGTYPLPEAQIDRFLMKLKISYPSRDEEKRIIDRVPAIDLNKIEKVCQSGDLARISETGRMVYVDEKIKDYVVNIVFASRYPEEENLKDLRNLIQFGSSPRASLYLIETAKALAFINGRGYVTPEDVKMVAHEVMRHRIILTYEAEAEGKTTDDIITRILDSIVVP